MDTEKKSYLDFLQKFYDHGLLKEVYRSEKAIVVNVYNQFYMAIDRTFLDKNTEKYAESIPCFIMNSAGLKRIIEDDSYVKRFYLLLPEEDKEKSLRFLSESHFQAWLKKDSAYKQKDIPEHMDLEFEALLLEKGADAVRAQLLEERKLKEREEKEAERSRKKGKFNLFRKK